MMRITASLTVAAIALLTIGVHAANWPAFRGQHARGIGDGAPPTAWDASTATNIRWHVPLPGLSHASPIVWDGRVYVVSAEAEGSTLDRATEGVVFATDTIEHKWTLHSLDVTTGDRLWSRTVHTGVPRQPRHVRGTYANATPATDGRVIVASFGNEGLFAFNMDGTTRWRREMAPPRADASLDPASSPVIAGGLAIVQNDWQEGGFAAAYDLMTGEEKWRVARNEGLTWSTPGLWSGPDGRLQVIFNSPRWIRAHDAATGEELWRLNNVVESPWDRVPTPVPSGNLLLVGGGGPQGPLMALRAGARGEITDTADTVAWRITRGSPYLPTPVVYEGLVYALADNGVLSVYRETDGSLVYRQRVATDAGTISASPVAAGGRLYFASQDGDVFVVRAGETFELLARNPMGEPLFATPALTGNTVILRTAAGIFAVADNTIS